MFTVQTIIAIAVSIIAIAIAAVMWQLFGILGRVKQQITPILTNVEKTLEEVNQELERVNEIIKTGESVVDKVNMTTKIAQQAVSSPLIKLVSVGAGIKKAYDSLTRRK